jgi:hypothetical protein
MLCSEQQHLIINDLVTLKQSGFLYYLAWVAFPGIFVCKYSD